MRKKKLISIILIIVMMIGTIPLYTFADEGYGDGEGGNDAGAGVIETPVIPDPPKDTPPVGDTTPPGDDKKTPEDGDKIPDNDLTPPGGEINDNPLPEDSLGAFAVPEQTEELLDDPDDPDDPDDCDDCGVCEICDPDEEAKGVRIELTNVDVRHNGNPVGQGSTIEFKDGDTLRMEFTWRAPETFGNSGFYIKDGDFAALSRFAHPDFGIVFSPHTTISLLTNRCFSAEQIAMFGTDTTVYVWGTHSCTGEPIDMTPVEYFAEYVYPMDYYACASVIGVNRVVASGNALENTLDEFPNLLFVDFHIPGGERDAPDELDWSTLRLGFEEHDGRLWLTVILRSTWIA